MDRRKLRSRIQQEKKEIPDRELFLSERYKKLLRAVAGEITDGEPVQVKVYADPYDHLGGWCDGKTVAVNILNSFTQSFPTLSLKSESILGILGHECGHKNYTDTSLRRAYLEGMEQGRWYPGPPKCGTKKEEQALQEIQACFQAKDAAALSVLSTAASFLHNNLEDVFVEEKMCRRYPGSIRQGILLNRRRRLEQVPSVKKQKAMGYKKLSILLNLASQQALSGEINNWDGYQGEEISLVKELAPILEKAVASATTRERVEATNQILLKLWEPIRQEIEALREKQKEKEEGEEKDQTKGQKEKDKAQEDGAEEEELSSQLLVFFVKEPFLDQDGTQTGEPKKAAVQEAGRSIKTGEELNAILFCLAKERALKKVQMEIKAGLLRELEEIPFERGHEEVRKEIVRKDEVTEEARRREAAEKEEIRRVMRRLKALLLPILQRQAGTVERGRLFGPQLDRRHLTNRQGRIFAKRAMPDTDLNTALVVLVDLSNSMAGGGRIEAARRAALCLYAFCREVELPIAVYGHHTDGRQHLSAREETVYLHSLAEFEPDADDRYRILAMKPYGANRDGAALLYAAHKLLKRPEAKKILLLISDGVPNATNYRGKAAKMDLLELKKDLTKKGITFLAAAIGSDKEVIAEIYQEAFLDISDLKKLPAALSGQLLMRIGRR